MFQSLVLRGHLILVIVGLLGASFARAENPILTGKATPGPVYFKNSQGHRAGVTPDKPNGVAEIAGSMMSPWRHSITRRSFLDVSFPVPDGESIVLIFPPTQEPRGSDLPYNQSIEINRKRYGSTHPDAWSIETVQGGEAPLAVQIGFPVSDNGKMKVSWDGPEMARVAKKAILGVLSEGAGSMSMANSKFERVGWGRRFMGNLSSDWIGLREIPGAAWIHAYNRFQEGNGSIQEFRALYVPFEAHSTFVFEVDGGSSGPGKITVGAWTSEGRGQSSAPLSFPDLLTGKVLSIKTGATPESPLSITVVR